MRIHAVYRDGSVVVEEIAAGEADNGGFSSRRLIQPVACDAGIVRAPTTIHFICTGNIYRSRLAEAYCASKRIPDLRVFSSGIAAGRDGNALISPYAAEALAGCDLSGYAAERWQRTTASLVRGSDVLVFMESEHHRFCESWIEPGRQRIEVWEIEDVGPIDATKIPAKVERTFHLIRQRVDSLLKDLGLPVPEAEG